MSRENRLQQLLDSRQVWLPGQVCTTQQSIETGYPALDYRLGGGWPVGVLTELLVDTPGVGELSLLMPALVRLLRSRLHQPLVPQPGIDVSQRGNIDIASGPMGQVAWIAPPFIPYAPALAQHGLELSQVLIVDVADAQEALWAMEQVLRSAVCVAVFGWFAAINDQAMRRLQLAAEAGDSWAVILRSSRFVNSVSSAPLRIRVVPQAAEIELQLLRNRFGLTGSLRLSC
jgi:hypothetical protein